MTTTPKPKPKADLLPKTQCCGYQWGNLPCPVMWNPFNKVVQCHNCGLSWEPSPVTTPIHAPQPAAPSVDEGAERLSHGYQSEVENEKHIHSAIIRALNGAEPYMSHHSDCHVWKVTGKRICTCGLCAILEQLKN